jgi:hypothetical protein
MAKENACLTGKEKKREKNGDKPVQEETATYRSVRVTSVQWLR